jgi:hypothetical protein
MWLARLLLVLMLFSATSCAREVAEVTNERVTEPPRKASCAVDTFQALPDVRLVAASQERSLAPHCKVTGVIGTETNFELLLPDVWNGKFVMGGGGGFVGAVVNTALGFGVLQSGYATVGTDTGHSGHPLDASWALNNMERVVSFGHQAVHRTAVTAKVLIADYYDQTISSSLFYGCSRGGGQALMEAQRYPDDFDGIVASAPAYNWTGELGGRNTRLNAAMYPRPDQLDVPVIPPTKQQLLGEAIMAQCDAMDGLEDGILSNPLVCDFEVESLACAAQRLKSQPPEPSMMISTSMASCSTPDSRWVPNCIRVAGPDGSPEAVTCSASFSRVCRCKKVLPPLECPACTSGLVMVS